MGKKDITNEIVEKYDKLINYDIVNKALMLEGGFDINVAKKTLVNISKWALNGASDKDIRDNLELNAKQFDILCSVCPALVYVIQNSREMADIVIAGSLFQTAIGGQKVRKQQAIKINDLNEDGIKVGEHIEIVWVEEELPPNPNLLKFLAEHKLSEKFGNKQTDKDEEIKKVVGSFDATDMKAVEDYLIKGK